MAGPRTKGVDSSRRTLEVLLQFTEAKPEWTIDELINELGLSQPSAYRYLSLLRELRLLEERSRGTYVLGPRILDLGRAAGLAVNLQADAQPILDRLAADTGETALCLRRAGESAVAFAIAESVHAVSISFQLGHTMPLHAGAGAKLLLANLSKAKRDRYLERARPELTDAGVERLTEDLARIRESGKAESRGEVDDGVWACAFKVNLRHDMLGAISVVGPEYRLDDAAKARIEAHVRAAAAELDKVSRT